MLNNSLSDSGRFRACQNDMTRLSRATISVPADGPNRRTAVNTKVSEIEIVAGTIGRRTVAEPLTSVIAASMSH